jgi:dihydrofolate reductase
MIISIIAAMAENRVIGRQGAIPWDIPEDRRRFRELTMGHTVIMGRKTFESIGHPLPGRTTIILTRQPGFRTDGCIVVNGLAEALAAAAGCGEAYICGGGELYREALPLADRICLTIVPGNPGGDAFFPDLPAGEFAEKERLTVPGPPSCTFVVFVRRSTAGRPCSEVSIC